MGCCIFWMDHFLDPEPPGDLDGADGGAAVLSCEHR